MEITKKDYKTLIKLAFREDLQHNGDITTDPIFKNETAVFNLIAKQNGILCGKNIFIDVFDYIDRSINVNFYFNDKNMINNGDIIAKVIGNVANILKGERTALNFICNLSGIATKTSLFVKEANDKIKILDTRKTLPGYRMLHKYAVHCGGGYNHRIGLHDMVLIKDNHIDVCEGLTKAVKKITDRWGRKYKIEVEARNIEEVKEALTCKVNRIMLDNMDTNKIREAVRVINKEAETEISGNVTIEKIKDLSVTGADYVSIGELTHSFKAFDFSLKKEKK
ncbi:MAG: carboxylating nicotinate-nucleotide diphosphorylase [Spirochaetes bacterium]|nr:carboxylating nicotinate-nucleotide diphosphorylase [Spirochaetota bacterium]